MGACVAQKRRFSASERPAREPVVTPPQPTPPPQPEAPEEEPQTKQRRREELQRHSPDQRIPDTDHNLLDFCDEMLYEIFKYLDTPSIMAVMQ